ncbi:MAG: glycosyltransferase [Pirellula sp.]
MSLATNESRFRDLRILVLRDNWFGCTGMSAFNAALRTGAHVDAICETDFIPPYWQDLRLRIAKRLLLPIAVREFNAALLDLIRLVRPHLFLATKGTYVQKKTLETIKKLGTITFCFFPDTSFVANGNELTEALREYDWVFSTKSFGPSDFERLFAKKCCSYLPHAFDPDVHRQVTPLSEIAQQFECDVSFIGTYSQRKHQLLEEIVSRRPSLRLKIWGNQWEKSPTRSLLRKHIQFSPVLGHSYAAAIAGSKVNLGMLREGLPGASDDDQITSRTFHIPACGGLMLHPRTKDLLDIFDEGQDCLCFSSPDELLERIDEVLANDDLRMRVARGGYQTVHQAHKWDHRIATILDHFVDRFRTNLQKRDE